MLALVATMAVACSSGTRVAPALSRSPIAPASAERWTLPTWVAHDGAYEIVARDVRDIAAVQPGIEREYETFRAIHGTTPRRVQFVVVADEHDAATDTSRLALREGMVRVIVDARIFAARPVVAPWSATRMNAEGRP